MMLSLTGSAFTPNSILLDRCLFVTNTNPDEKPIKDDGKKKVAKKKATKKKATKKKAAKKKTAKKKAATKTTVEKGADDD